MNYSWHRYQMWQPQQRKKKHKVETRTTASTTESILKTTSSMMLRRKSTRFHRNTDENFLGHSSLLITFFNDHVFLDVDEDLELLELQLFSSLSKTSRSSLTSLFSMTTLLINLCSSIDICVCCCF